MSRLKPLPIPDNWICDECERKIERCVSCGFIMCSVCEDHKVSDCETLTRIAGKVVLRED